MENGESPANGSPASGVENTAPTATTAAPTTAQPSASDTNAPQGGDKASLAKLAEAAPFLGSATKDGASGGPAPAPKDGGSGAPAPAPKDGQGQDNPTPATEEDYLKAVTKDEAILGKNDDLVFDQALIKAVIPACQKHGISPEAVNEIANLFAKQQLEGARAVLKERSDKMAESNAVARATFSDADFAKINNGIDKNFEPGGVMNFVIRHSELGSNLEFLKLMLRIGGENLEDTGKGAGEGGGDGGGDPNGLGGISKLW